MAAINYPALEFQRELVSVARSDKDLSYATRLGLKWLENELIVDARGHAFKVAGVRKIRILAPKLEVGAILGFIFGNPTYEVELLFEGEPTQMSVEEVKRLLFRSFRRHRGWRATLDFPELRKQVLNAKSVPEIIELLLGGPR